MPTGPGVWPAFWSTGYPWPYHGEIDILEYISARNFNAITIHTSDNCTMPLNDLNYSTGTWATVNNIPVTNCYVGRF